MIHTIALCIRGFAGSRVLCKKCFASFVMSSPLQSFVVFVFGSSSVFFFGFLLSVKRSLFFVCNTTDSDKGNDKDENEGDDNGDEDGVEDDKKSVNNRLDTVDGVDGDIDNFIEEVFFVLLVEPNDLPCLFFWGGVSKI
jgi:hypothetical protein